MRVLFVLVAAAPVACGLAETGDVGPSLGGDAGRDSSFDAPTPDVRAAMEATADRAPDTEGPPRDAGSEHASPPEDAKSEPAPDSALENAGDALLFDGMNYVSAGTLALPNEFTLEAWINPAATDDGETYIVAEDQAYNPPAQFRFGLVNEGQLFFTMSDKAGSTHNLGISYPGYNLISTTTIPTGSWTHVAVTKDGKYFGLLIGTTQAAAYTVDKDFSAGTNVDFRVAGRLGQEAGSLEGGFDGTIDEVRFWNAPQSNSAIEANMKSEIATTSSLFSQLFLYYRFNDGSGTTATDMTGHYPGTLTGSPLPIWVTSGAF
jgi:Concanavalin A-like lectin/glucanases superfamily